VQKIKIYLILITVLLVLSLSVLLWFTSAFKPIRLGNIAVFYAIAAVFVFSTATLIGFYLRKRWGQRELLNAYAATASRQAVWLSTILIVALILSHLNLFSWVNAVLLVLTFVFFESYLLTRNKDSHQHYDRES
jgi:hypothetical protein